MRIPTWCESPIVCTGKDGTSATVGIKPMRFTQSFQWCVDDELVKRQSMRALAFELQQMAQEIIEGLDKKP